MILYPWSLSFTSFFGHFGFPSGYPIIHLSGYIRPIIQLSVGLSVYLSCQLFGQLNVWSVIKLFVQFLSSNNYLDKQFCWKCKSWDVDHRWNDDKTLLNSYL